MTRWDGSHYRPPMTNVQAELLAEIEVFLATRGGISETAFGVLAVNDGKLVRRLREGKNMTLATIERAKQFIVDQDGGRDPVLDEAIAVAGGPEAFAGVCGATVAEVRSWRSVPSALMAVVAAATGIPPSRLRPDLHAPGNADADRMVA